MILGGDCNDKYLHWFENIMECIQTKEAAER